MKTCIAVAIALILPLLPAGAVERGDARDESALLSEYDALRATLVEAVQGQHARSFLAKVDAAERADDRGDFCPAANTLGALGNEVRAATGKWLAPAEAGRVNARIAAVRVLLPPDPCVHRALRVPGDFATIQRAIDAAQDGDTLLVGAGSYRESLVIAGKRLWIIGATQGRTELASADGRAGVVAFGAAGGGELRNLAFRGGEYSIRGGSSARAPLPAGLRVRNVAISGGYRGIYGAFSALTVRDTSIVATEWHGLSLTYVAEKAEFIGIQIYRAMGNGAFIVADGPGDISLSGHFHHNYKRGIEVQGNGGHVAMFFVTLDHNGPDPGSTGGIGVLLIGADAGIALGSFNDHLADNGGGCSGVGLIAKESTVVTIGGSVFRDNCLGLVNMDSELTMLQNDFNHVNPAGAELLAGIGSAVYHDLGDNVCGAHLGTPQQMLVPCQVQFDEPQLPDAQGGLE